MECVGTMEGQGSRRQGKVVGRWSGNGQRIRFQVEEKDQERLLSNVGMEVTLQQKCPKNSDGLSWTSQEAEHETPEAPLRLAQCICVAENSAM